MLYYYSQVHKETPTQLVDNTDRCDELKQKHEKLCESIFLKVLETAKEHLSKSSVLQRLQRDFVLLTNLLSIHSPTFEDGAKVMIIVCLCAGPEL